MAKFYPIVFLAFILSSLSTNAQQNAPDFEDLLDSNCMIFKKPKGFKKVSPVKNNAMNYEKAFKHKKADFEVRYAIRHHDSDAFRTSFEMTLTNISGQNHSDYTVFNKESVYKEFGADNGATYMISPIEAFSKDYKYCLVVGIFKQGKGDAFIFYLSNDNTVIPELMKPIFGALQFKKDVTSN